MSLSLRWVELIVLLYTFKEITSKVEFTNIVCTDLDPEFCQFEYCRLKSVNRTYKYFSVKAIMHKKPITKTEVNLELKKRFSGYKPFLYNVTVDGCRFLRNTRSSPIAQYFYNMFKEYSNLNHSCPFNHDLMVEKLSVSYVNTHLTDVLPFPIGDYLFESNWIAYGINRANIKVYLTLS